MNTYTNQHLHCRAFGSACLDTQHFQEWLTTYRRQIPIALTHDYVQVEWLLSAIQMQVERSVTRIEAAEIVLADPTLRDHELAEITPQWLLGGEAYRRWAILIAEAVVAGDLELLDFASKLPVFVSEADQSEQDRAGYGAGHEWKHEAKTMAIQYCVEALDDYAVEHGQTDECPMTQDKAARKLVADLASMGRKLKSKRPISFESALAVLKPWTAPDAARAIIRAREIRKFTGS